MSPSIKYHDSPGNKEQMTLIMNVTRWRRNAAGLRWWLGGDSLCQFRRRGFDPWPGRSHLLGAAKPVATATEPVFSGSEPQQLSPSAPTTEARVPKARASQEKPPHHTERVAPLPQLEKSLLQNEDPVQPWTNQKCFKKRNAVPLSVCTSDHLPSPPLK